MTYEGRKNLYWGVGGAALIALAVVILWATGFFDTTTGAM